MSRSTFSISGSVVDVPLDIGFGWAAGRGTHLHHDREAGMVAADGQGHKGGVGAEDAGVDL
jgi:hypothetical protein